MKLSPAMRAALHAAKRDDGLRRVHNPDLPGQPTWPAHPNTLAALVRRELVKRDRILNKKRNPVDLWKITPAGETALQPDERTRPDRPRFLADRRRPGPDYTKDRYRAIDDLEAIDPNEVGNTWRRRSAEQHAAAQDRKQRARRARAA